MAIREKTIIFAADIPSTAYLSIPNNTVTNLPQFTVFIPESSVTITSAYVEIGFQDITTVAGNIGNHSVGLQIGASGYSTVASAVVVSQSGENMAGVWGPYDFSSHFAANWSGSSMTCDIQVLFNQTTGTNLGMECVNAILYVTYQYDDTSPTQIKTIRVPMESLVSTLPTSWSNPFTIPSVFGAGGMVTEANPVLRQAFAVLEGNESKANNTTSFVLTGTPDSGLTRTFTAQQGQLASDRFCRWVFPGSPLASRYTGSANFNLYVSSGAVARLNHVTATMFITYEFTLAGTTQMLNSLLIPFEVASPIGAATSAEASKIQRDIIIPEANVSLKPSAVRLNWVCAATPGTLGVSCGAQSFRTYTTSATVACGMFCLQQRVDAGSAVGAAWTLATGRNTLDVSVYATSTTNQISNISGYFILNYTCDVPLEGVGAGLHTVLKPILPWDPALDDRRRITDIALDIPESEYWISSIGFGLLQWNRVAVNAVTLDVECLPGEGKGGGYYDLYVDAYQSDAEAGTTMIWVSAKDIFLIHPNDLSTDKIDAQLSRDYRYYTPGTTSVGIISVLTYHSLTWTISGTLSGNDPLLPTTVDLVNETSSQIVQTQTLSAGTTSYTFTVYDNTEEYHVSAYQDNAHIGRSGVGTAI